ncbi:hypothetical protein KR222_002864 [Zaprionus bogoriensis]|nr:hypothetical protein KR222_002864 [Zaprionus bogoriensis]
MAESELKNCEERTAGDALEVQVEERTKKESENVSQIVKLEENLDETQSEVQVTSGVNKNRKVKARKSLKQSVIRRLCKIPSKDALSAISASAQVMYTNPQFSMEGSLSACDVSNTLSQPPSRLSKTKAKKGTASKRVTKSKAKRIGRQFKAKNRSTRLPAKPPQPSDSGVAHQCLCTEINGEVYRVMDLPTGLKDFLLGARRSAAMPRLATRRIVGKRPT